MSDHKGLKEINRWDSIRVKVLFRHKLDSKYQDQVVLANYHEPLSQLHRPKPYKLVLSNKGKDKIKVHKRKDFGLKNMLSTNQPLMVLLIR